MEQLIPILLLLAVMYFLLIRPQQQRVKAQRALVTSLDVGDDVVTLGGVLGRILTLDDETVTLETTPGTVLRLRRSAIGGRSGTESGVYPAEGADSTNGAVSLDRSGDADHTSSLHDADHYDGQPESAGDDWRENRPERRPGENDRRPGGDDPR